VKRAAMLTVLLLGLVPGPEGQATLKPTLFLLARTNPKLHGQVLDYTHNHGADNRLWSPALGQKRDLYVYLPPGYDPNKRYPLIVWLHGFAQEEASFLRDVIVPLDKAVGAGIVPPVIMAAPDGSLFGEECVFQPGSFFMNSKAGRFEDYLMVDVWNFLMTNFSIRPEPEAHAIAGVSMGGNAAFNKAIKYQDRFKSVLGMFPPLNVRWLDCKGRYMSDFDPNCWGWRTDFTNDCEIVGRFFKVVLIPQGMIVRPLFGRRNPDTCALVSKENPIEMLDAFDVREGQLAMYVAYGGKDEFNIKAQVDSFLYRARERGLTIKVAYDPNGHHNRTTAKRFFPDVLQWLGERLMPYGPCD
jgi:S-formylglutathione hydrolase FrmB